MAESEAIRPPVSMLRPALELAWAVAKVGSQARPPLPVPGRLRPIMRVVRLPDRMLETVRQVVESDGEFRERVVGAATDEEVLGRPSWLWLVRPPGWDAELAGLVDEAAGEESEHREKTEARAAAKRLGEVTAALQRTQAELVALKAAHDELRGGVARRMKEDRSRDDEIAALRRQLDEAHGEIDRIRSLNDRLGADIGSRSAELDRLAEQREADRHLVSELRAQLEAEQRHVEDARHANRMAEDEVSRLRERLSKAEAGARALADDIAGVQPASRAGGGDGAMCVGDGTVPSAGSAQAATATWGAPSEVPGRRVPLQLPPATFEDSPEAAAHLVRAARVLLAVDGYNVTLRSWPSLGLSEQRRRLVDSLAELVMRRGTEVLVVFDGTDNGNRLQPPPAVRGKLRVEFSPSEVEADDVIIKAVGSFPRDRPVVVATDDRRVRDSTSDLGANVISVDQLLSVIRRGPQG